MLPDMPITGQNAQQVPSAADRGSAGSYGHSGTSSNANSTVEVDRLVQAIESLAHGFAGFQAECSEERRERQIRDRLEAESRRPDVQAQEAWQALQQADAAGNGW
jgi:hypothetical protein